MAQYSKIVLSGSVNGRPIKVAATATPGTLIHTAGAATGESNCDEIYLFACNTDTVTRILTIEWGGVSSPDDTIMLTLAARAGLVLIIPGLVLQNSLVCRAFASGANVVTITGFANRITA